MTYKINNPNTPAPGDPAPERPADGPQPPVIDAATESLRHPDGVGKSVSDCGDTIEIQIALDGDVVKHVSYNVHGCSFTLVSARAAVALIRGKKMKEARNLAQPETIDNALGGLPEHNKHCTELAAQAVQDALRNALITAREPWKKLYRK